MRWMPLGPPYRMASARGLRLRTALPLLRNFWRALGKRKVAPANSRCTLRRLRRRALFSARISARRIGRAERRKREDEGAAVEDDKVDDDEAWEAATPIGADPSTPPATVVPPLPPLPAPPTPLSSIPASCNAGN